MVILFTTYPLGIQRAIVNIPIIWNYCKHTCKISQCLCYLNSWSPIWPYISFIIFRSSTKNLNIFGPPLSPTSYAKPFELNSNEFNSNFTHVFISIFLDQAHFCESEKIYFLPKLHCYPSRHFFQVSVSLKQLKKRGSEGERAQPSGPLRPSSRPT